MRHRGARCSRHNDRLAAHPPMLCGRHGRAESRALNCPGAGRSRRRAQAPPRWRPSRAPGRPARSTAVRFRFTIIFKWPRSTPSPLGRARPGRPRLATEGSCKKKTWVPTEQSPWADGLRVKPGHGVLVLHYNRQINQYPKPDSSGRDPAFRRDRGHLHDHPPAPDNGPPSAAGRSPIMAPIL